MGGFLLSSKMFRRLFIHRRVCVRMGIIHANTMQIILVIWFICLNNTNDLPNFNRPSRGSHLQWQCICQILCHMTLNVIRFTCLPSQHCLCHLFLFGVFFRSSQMKTHTFHDGCFLNPSSIIELSGMMAFFNAKCIHVVHVCVNVSWNPNITHLFEHICYSHCIVYSFYSVFVENSSEIFYPCEGLYLQLSNWKNISTWAEIYCYHGQKIDYIKQCSISNFDRYFQFKTVHRWFGRIFLMKNRFRSNYSIVHSYVFYL